MQATLCCIGVTIIMIVFGWSDQIILERSESLHYGESGILSCDVCGRKFRNICGTEHGDVQIGTLQHLNVT
jgi:hypothetical protein